MDSNNLKAFISVAETRSFSRAADQLFITQPAISKRIAALEQELGNRLFNRIGRRIDLTPAGEKLLPRAKLILDELRQAKIAIDNLSTETRGILHFGMSHHIGMRRMPALLRRYSELYPQVELKIAFLGSEEANLQVEQGALEFALITLPDEHTSDLQHLKIWADPLAIVTATEYPDSIQTQQDIAALQNLPVILPAADTETHRLIQAAFGQKGIELNAGMETNNLETIKMMVSIGIGWSVLPKTMIDPDLRAHDVETLSLQRSLGAVLHPKRTLSNAAKAMLELLTENE